MGDTFALPAVSGPSPQTDEGRLIDAARSDPAAFGVLYQRYEPRIYRYIRSRTRCAEDAEDLTQQVFLGALGAVPRYDQRDTPFAAWLFRIARNAVINDSRRRRSELSWDLLPEALHPQEGQEPEAMALEEEKLLALRNVVSTLDTGTRELLELRFGAGLTVPEIARVLGKSEASVYKRLARTLQRMKERYHG